MLGSPSREELPVTGIEQSEMSQARSGQCGGRVLVVDRHPLTRAGIRDLLAATAPDLTATSAAPDTAAGPADLVLYNANDLSPGDARVVADMAALRRALPATPVVLLSPAPAAETARLDLAGHIQPTLTADVLAATLRLLLAGGSYFPPTDGRPTACASLADLTRREAEVLTKLCQGKANKIIAYELGMAENTVKVHAYRIMKKLGAANRTEVVSMVHRMAS